MVLGGLMSQFQTTYAQGRKLRVDCPMIYRVDSIGILMTGRPVVLGGSGLME